jgi:hypothetical protein
MMDLSHSIFRDEVKIVIKKGYIKGICIHLKLALYNLNGGGHVGGGGGDNDDNSVM